MKNKKEQIEEMAKCMGEKNFLCTDDCENCIQIPCKCKLVKQSKLLYKAGYRKASDVIDEFSKRLKEKFDGYEATYYNGYEEGWHDLAEEIDELATEMRQEVEK